MHAVKALQQVITFNRTIDWVTANRPQWLQQPLSQELVYGTLRHYYSLKQWVDTQLKAPLRKKDQDLYILMLVGAHQLANTRIKDHAAISETVNACKLLQKPWAKGLLNGVLRNLQRNPQTSLDRSFDHAPWMAAAITDQYGEKASELLAANNLRAPQTLRINSLKTSVADYKVALNNANIDYSTQPWADYGADAITLQSPQPSQSLPGWAAGQVAIQDLGGQLAADLSCPALALTQRKNSPLRILDACTAPGGKLFHIIERLASQGRATEFTAIELRAQRAEQTREIALRLGHDVRIVLGDATNLEWWDGIAFDHIIVDAPCSGTGTIRRHPDIKVLLQPAQIDLHKLKQAQLLTNLWHTLAVEGTLLYCTCSILEAENDSAIAAFINNSQASNQSNNKDAHVTSISLPTGQKTKYGWQLLPTNSNTDGFYYALLTKAALGNHSQ